MPPAEYERVRGGPRSRVSQRCSTSILTLIIAPTNTIPTLVEFTFLAMLDEHLAANTIHSHRGLTCWNLQDDTDGIATGGSPSTVQDMLMPRTGGDDVAIFAVDEDSVWRP